MFSLFQEKPPEDQPSESEATPSEETRFRRAASQLQVLATRAATKLRSAVPEGVHWNPVTVVLGIALLATVVFGVHEQRVAARLQAQRGAPAARALPPGEARTVAAQPRSAEEERLAAQISALNAKLDAITRAQPPAQAPAAQPAPKLVATKPSPVHAPARRSEVSDVTVIHRVPQQPKPDPRWQKVQDQLDAQGKQIDSQGKQLESTRQAIASARTDLEGSIAKTHEDLVALQRKGERNYYEFSLDKSKNFRTVGSVGVSLRKANTKDQYADLKLIVDDREVSKKHLNLYEPVTFYLSGERQPVELVINGISKDHIRGYISAARYKASGLQIGSTTAAPPATSTVETNPPHHKLVASPR
jgi:hypothetical protein